MNEEKLFTLKPEFNIGKNLLINFLIWLPISAAAGVESGIIYLTSSKGPFPYLLAFSVIPAIIVFVILMLLAFLNEKFDYKDTEYTVFKNRVEFREGFINTQITMLLLADIKEIHLKKSLLQKICGLGTIRLVTSANTSRTAVPGLHSTGINFKDIKNPNEVFTDMKKAVEAKR